MLMSLSKDKVIIYNAKLAPALNIKHYSELIREYEKTGKLPPRLTIVGMAVDASKNENNWQLAEEDLDRIAEKLKGIQIRKDHSDSVDSIIGIVKNAWREGDKVFFEGEIADPNLIPKILLGYVRHTSIQIRAPDIFCLNCLRNLGRREEEARISHENVDKPCPRCGAKELYVKNAIPVEQSIVSLPAYPNAEFVPIGFKAALNKYIGSPSTKTISSEKLKDIEKSLNAIKRLLRSSILLQLES